jgi:hypothetical protein
MSHRGQHRTDEGPLLDNALPDANAVTVSQTKVMRPHNLKMDGMVYSWLPLCNTIRCVTLYQKRVKIPTLHPSHIFCSE